MRRVPMRRRQTIRSLACAISVPKSSVFRILKDQKIKRVSSTVKPLLTPQNEMARLQFSLDEVSVESRTFYKTPQKVHIDEKWFYLSKVKNTYYLLNDEEPPERSCKSKRFITKVMFMAAVAQPQRDEDGNCLFDGLLGIWPFVKTEVAKRSSRNRPAGANVTKTVDSVGRQEITDMMKDKLIPAIRQKWPHPDKVVIIQQDNARPHAKEDDATLATELKKNGWKMKLLNQPANSPDYNALDLGFFNSIQSIQHQKAPSNIDELIQVVQESYWEQSADSYGMQYDRRREQ